VTEIREIKVREVPTWSVDETISNPIIPSLTNQIRFEGFPAIRMPGCVRTRTVRNKGLIDKDPKGNILICDGPVFEMPTFSVDTLSGQEEQVKEKPILTPQISNIPETNNQKKKEKKQKESGEGFSNNDFNTDLSNLDLDQQAKLELPCPRPGSPPPGAPSKLGNKVVLRYEKNGELCETIYQDRALFDVINSYVPPPATLASTALIATTSVVMVTAFGQPLAKFLQGKIKGQVKSFSKKITKKLLALRGKKPKILSVSERRKAQRDR
tara:strand:- start:263 stop:1066 length:804 start_codon:yes stop_codon:yes gene_type:complete